MRAIENPWANFTISGEMIHDLDREAFWSHNSKVELRYKFLSHLAPEPWIGNTQAKLLVLLANPGATEGDAKGIEQRGARRINELSISNLRGELQDYPHFFFSPELVGTDGHSWYQKRFRHLIESATAQKVSRNVLSCELAPYHSQSWKKPRKSLPTQAYTFELVQQAMERDAVILIGRGSREWFDNVPRLEKYPNYFQPSSVQCAYISPKNYGKNFAKIAEAIS